MTGHNTGQSNRCDHCAGVINSVSGYSGRADKTMAFCNGCGCWWAEGMILTHKGQGCPVHGQAALRTAVSRAARWMAESLEKQPAPTRP